MTAKELIDAPLDQHSHVVLLGAGASRAAFPDGDASGLLVPVMRDFAQTLGLQPIIDKAHLDLEPGEQNFECIYDRLASNQEHASIKGEIERTVRDYFSALSLPVRATIYDSLLLALRPKDAVATFNWDPFLFDAHRRNCGIPLPQILFLHGCVRIGVCRGCEKTGPRNEQCPECSQQFSDGPLLYPIRHKNYSDDPYIRESWDAVKSLFKQAFTLTIFGYGAPESDEDAKSLLMDSWFQGGTREVETIEIIDTADSTCLHSRWSPFTPTLHYDPVRCFEQSRIARWPRRSTESLLHPMSKGVVCGAFPLPKTDSLPKLQDYVSRLIQKENTISL